jgi:hypothetical protein
MDALRTIGRSAARLGRHDIHFYVARPRLPRNEKGLGLPSNKLLLAGPPQSKRRSTRLGNLHHGGAQQFDTEPKYSMLRHAFDNGSVNPGQRQEQLNLNIALSGGGRRLVLPNARRSREIFGFSGYVDTMAQHGTQRLTSTELPPNLEVVLWATHQWGRHGFDGDAYGQEACRGAHTRNRVQNDNCQSTNGIRSLIN